MSLLKLNIGNKTYLAKYETAQQVVIGDRIYSTTRIGNQLWLAENLDLKWETLKVGQSGMSFSEQRANYYSNDESTYGERGNRYGLLYNWVAVNYINEHKNDLLPEGWHVASYNEWDMLITRVGGESVAGIKLKSTSGWINDNNGDGSTAFSAFPSGNNFGSIGSAAYFWTATEDDKNYAYCSILTTGTPITLGINAKNVQYSIRLVKDAT